MTVWGNWAALAEDVVACKDGDADGEFPASPHLLIGQAKDTHIA
jgi:hypothetical protein